jgi:hypothetical protein
MGKPLAGSAADIWTRSIIGRIKFVADERPAPRGPLVRDILCQWMPRDFTKDSAALLFARS